MFEIWDIKTNFALQNRRTAPIREQSVFQMKTKKLKNNSSI